MWEKRLEIFDAIVEKCPRFERKGKSMIYTSANGMKGYVLIPDHMLTDLDNLADLLNESYDYVMSLDPK